MPNIFLHSKLVRLFKFHFIKFRANFPSVLVAHRKAFACSWVKWTASSDANPPWPNYSGMGSHTAINPSIPSKHLYPKLSTVYPPPPTKNVQKSPPLSMSIYQTFLLTQ